MKLVTFVHGSSAPHVGVLVEDDQRVVDCTAARPDHPELASMQALIEGGAFALDHAREVAATVPSTVTVADVQLLAPVPVPMQMRDFLCFEEHFRRSLEVGAEFTIAQAEDPEAMRAELERRGATKVPDVFYRQPIYYKANRFACVGHGADIRWPGSALLMDYELEFACWIGRGGRDIAKADAHDHILGYSVFNDFTARDVQLAEMSGGLGPAKAKDFDTSNSIGPCIVTADAIDPYDLTMIARINGEEVSRGSSASMKWRFDDVIAHLSTSETLYPGEFLGSGTVGGGCGLERMAPLQAGDVVELEIEGIGVLRNRLVKEDG